MSNDTLKRAGGIATSAVVVLASCGTVYATVSQGMAQAETAYAAEVPSQEVASSVVKVAQVLGDFSFTQDALSSKADIADVFNRQTATLCGANTSGSGEPVAIGDWQISVTGDVQNEFVATIGELSQQDSKAKIMTCSCANNMAGGAAIVNASVRGIPITELVKQAGIDPDVNAVCFKAADGTETKLPLTYVIGHGAMLVYDINDEDLSETVGGTNQLWIESSSGKYFTRDVVGVEFTCEAEPPAEPTFEPGEYQYVNRPNVGIQLES